MAKLNKLRDDEGLGAGTVLLLPKREASGAAAPALGEVVVTSPREFRYSDKKRVFYRVQSGDTLERIARGFAVSNSEVVAWNAVDANARLVSGMVLTMWVKPSADLSGVRVLSESEVRVLVAGTPEFFDHFEGLKGKKRITVEAKSGDTLASLGRRHGMSVGWMERVNRQSRQKKLESGDRLVVYVPAGSASAKAAALRSTASQRGSGRPAAGGKRSRQACARATMIAPDPVPTSSTRGAGRVRSRAASQARPQSTSSSVSGRGISTAGLTTKDRPWNQARPRR